MSPRKTIHVNRPKTSRGGATDKSPTGGFRGRVWLLLLCCILGTQASTVTLRSSASVSSPVIRLSDVATVTGEHKEILDTLEVGRAAVPGCSRLLLRDELLLFTSLPEEVRNSVTLSGANRCSVKSIGVEVTLTDIEPMVKELLLNELSWNRDECEITFLDNGSSLAELWSSEYEVELGNLRNSDLKGRVMIPVYLQNEGKRERISLQGEITVNTKVLVAVRKLAPGEKLTKSDYRWQVMDISHLPYRPVTELEDNAEYTIRSGVIAPGAVITTNRITKSRMIERGMPVTILAKAGSVSVAISGRAREAGDIGDVIAVENSGSRKIIRGIVIKPGVVQVHRGGDV